LPDEGFFCVVFSGPPCSADLFNPFFRFRRFPRLPFLLVCYLRPSLFSVLFQFVAFSLRGPNGLSLNLTPCTSFLVFGMFHFLPRFFFFFFFFKKLLSHSHHPPFRQVTLHGPPLLSVFLFPSPASAFNPFLVPSLPFSDSLLPPLPSFPLPDGVGYFPPTFFP